MRPRYVIYAGVNGSGKSTLFHLYENSNPLPYVNLDDEIRKIGDWRDPQANLKAGVQVVKTIRSYLKNGMSFIEETTLCGHTIMKNIDYALQHNYLLEVYYIGIDSPELAKARVHQRVLKGGHGVADEDISRRYYQSFESLGKIFPVCSQLVLYDNTKRFRKIATYSFGVLQSEEDDLPEWYQHYIVNF